MHQPLVVLMCAIVPQGHMLGGDLALALAPHDPFFLFHHAGLDRLRRDWQTRNQHLAHLAWGYPTAQYGPSNQAGLHDCLGCDSSSGAAFTKELLLGDTSAARDMGISPLDDGAPLTPADLLCTFDRVYTYDVIAAPVSTSRP